MDNNLQTMTDEMDNIVSSFDSDDTDAFMQLTGQGKAQNGVKKRNIEKMLKNLKY